MEEDATVKELKNIREEIASIKSGQKEGTRSSLIFFSVAIGLIMILSSTNSWYQACDITVPVGISIFGIAIGLLLVLVPLSFIWQRLKNKKVKWF